MNDSVDAKGINCVRNYAETRGSKVRLVALYMLQGFIPLFSAKERWKQRVAVIYETVCVGAAR